MKKNIIIGGLSMLAAASITIAAIAQGPDDASETPAEKANKAAVISFYNAAMNAKDYATASKYFGDRYVNHNPTAEDGIDAFRKYVEYRKEHPESHNEIKRAFVDGDFVILHVFARLDPKTKGAPLIDIFRLEQGKIVEHWAVKGTFPDKPANNNGPF